ncbi:MAG: hypothetical protein V3V31_11660 [Methylococcales bacterium]
MIGQSGQNGLFRRRFSIFGQPPSPSQKYIHSKRAFLNASPHKNGSLLPRLKRLIHFQLNRFLPADYR